MSRRPAAAASVDLPAVSAGIEQRLTDDAWSAPWLRPRALSGDLPLQPTTEATAEVASFALALSGKRRTARRAGRLSRLVVHFALAASLALASLAAGCGKPDAGPGATAQAVQQLETVPGSAAVINAAARASPARYTDLLLVTPSSDSQPWAVMAPSDGTAPVLVDGQQAGLTTQGAAYSVPAHAIPVGTRDGPTQFLAPDAPAQQTADGSGTSATGVEGQVIAPWRLDERFAAATRAIAGQPTVLDAAYNAAAAVQAGGTHTYTDGVVLRVDPSTSSVQLIDRGLLQSMKPTRPEDTVFVAIRPEEASLYNPGQVVTLRDVVMTAQSADVQGQQQTFYVANAALQGARLEPTDTVDLQGIFNQRLQLSDADLAAQATSSGELPPAGTPAAATSTPAAAPLPAPGAAPQQPIIVERGGGGPSFLEDFLIWTWLTQPRYYGGSGVTIINPPASRAGGAYYYTPPTTAPPQSPAPQGQATRGAAIQASRSAVSGQASGTGGGVAATNKAAADSSARASAATAKGAALAGTVGAASAGKSTASAPSSSSSTAGRSSGRTGAGGGEASSGSGAGAGAGRSSSGAGGVGSSSGGSRTGGFGGTGSSSSSTS